MDYSGVGRGEIGTLYTILVLGGRARRSRACAPDRGLRSLRARYFHQGVAVRLYRRGLEPDGRLRQTAIARPRGLFRLGRLHLDDSAYSFWHFALDRHPRRWRGGDAGKPTDRR